MTGIIMEEEEIRMERSEMRNLFDSNCTTIQVYRHFVRNDFASEEMPA
jgi:hypothetical protein